MARVMLPSSTMALINLRYLISIIYFYKSKRGLAVSLRISMKKLYDINELN